MAFGYWYALERQANGWWLVRFPAIREALTEGETEAEARANASDSVLAALEGCIKAGRPSATRSWRRSRGKVASLALSKPALICANRYFRDLPHQRDLLHRRSRGEFAADQR
jgi:predicted RNase H-like HicB family nuclease